MRERERERDRQTDREFVLVRQDDANKVFQSKHGLRRNCWQRGMLRHATLKLIKKKTQNTISIKVRRRNNLIQRTLISDPVCYSQIVFIMYIRQCAYLNKRRKEGGELGRGRKEKKNACYIAGLGRSRNGMKM